MVRRAASSEVAAPPPTAGKAATASQAEKLPAPVQDSLRVTGGGYTVQSGDTLAAIAQRFGVDPAELLAANPHLTQPDGRPRAADGHWIYPGDVVKLPVVRDGASETGATVQRLRKAQTEALEAEAPAPAKPQPVPTPAKQQPVPTPAKPQPAPPPPPPEEQAVKRDGGGGWKSPQSDGGWRSPSSDSEGAPAAPAVWGGNNPEAGGPTYTPSIPPPPVYYPPSPPVYVPPSQGPYNTGGYQSPRSDGDARYGTGYPSTTTAGGTPTASGGLSKDQALIVGGVLAVVGLLGSSLIGTGTERAIGQAAAKEALQKYPLYTRDPRVTQYVQGVVDRLAANRERKDIKYEVRVVESNEPNAFALPGGYMFITTAALKQMRNEAELAGVMGHEMAHVEKRHGIKKLQEQLVAMGVAVAALGQSDDGNLAAAGAVALGLAMQGFSREHENESDKIGARMAAKAGYDPRGLVSFLETIKAQEHPNVELFSDHPTTEKRIAAVTKQIEKEGLLTGALDHGTDRYDQQVYWLRRGY